MSRFTKKAKIGGLSLTRAEGDQFYIIVGDERIDVEIVQIAGKACRVAIKASDKVKIGRLETEGKKHHRFG